MMAGVRLRLLLALIVAGRVVTDHGHMTSRSSHYATDSAAAVPHKDKGSSTALGDVAVINK